MKVLTGLALCCAALFAVATARPGGAPASSCTSMIPGASGHGNTEQQGDNPWMIDISAFPAANGSYYYVPGATYNVTLRRTAAAASAETLQGFFIQGRTMMTNMMVGAFADPSTYNQNTQLSLCSPTRSVGVTHSNAGAMNLNGPFTFMWTAPAAGTGTVQFLYTIVQVPMTWWAADASAALQEAAAQPVTDDTPTTDSAPQLQGVGQWTLLVMAAFTIALKTMLW